MGILLDIANRATEEVQRKMASSGGSIRDLLREELDAAVTDSNLCDPKILELSREVDEIVIKEQKRTYLNRKGRR